MEQLGREEDINNQQQDQRRRLKPPPPPPGQTENPQQPQKCPRCESLNTKFCYYNNYSLSQPRYFCKACRRYWTQGGTLRNVPVGGGCRKGKRSKNSSSSGDISRSQQPPPSLLPPPPVSEVPQNLTNHGIPNMHNIPTSPWNKEIGNLGLGPGVNSYYSGGGFLSSLASMQSFSRPQTFHQPLGGQFGGGGGSNLALLHGFNVPSLQPPQNQQILQQHEVYQMGLRDNKITEPFYPSDQSLVQPIRPMGSWTQSFINTTNPPSTSTTSFWNTTTNATTSGSSLNPNQLPDLPGYGPPS